MIPTIHSHPTLSDPTLYMYGGSYREGVGAYRWSVHPPDTALAQLTVRGRFHTQTDISQPKTDISQPTTDISQPTTDISQSTTDISQPTTDISRQASPPWTTWPVSTSVTHTPPCQTHTSLSDTHHGVSCRQAGMHQYAMLSLSDTHRIRR